MNEYKQKAEGELPDKEIVFSRMVKAGKRIYYLDVKRNRRDDLYLSITESKKVVDPDAPDHTFFEKHKIFLYHEDLDKFCNALDEVAHFLRETAGDPAKRMPYKSSSDAEVFPISSASDEDFPLKESSAPSKGLKVDFDIDF